MATIAGAQPTPLTADLGTISQSATPVVTPFTLNSPIAADNVRWYKITVPAGGDIGTAGIYLDLWTGPSGAVLGTYPDTEMALYDSAGTLIAENDDGGGGFASALSFGTCGSRPGTVGTIVRRDSNFAGQNGATLAAGDYYIGLISYNGTFGANYAFTSTATVRTGDLNFIYSATSIAATAAFAPASIATGDSSVLSVTATACGGAPALGAVVQATVPAALGGGVIDLFDNGIAPDTTADDGIYAATVNGTAGGTHVFACTATLSGGSSSASATLTVINPPPANDDCSAPALIPTAGSGPFSVAGDYSSAVLAPFSASNCGLTGGVKDVWYTFNTGSRAGAWTFSTCGGADLDTVISVHSACPTAAGFPANNQIATNSCADQGCGTGNLSLLTGVALTANTTYLVRVGHWTGFTGNQGFTLTLTPPPPPASNDDCDTAEVIPADTALSQTFAVSNAGGTTGDAGVTACTGAALANSTWYQFTAPSTGGNNGTWTVNSTGARAVAIYPATACPVVPDGAADLVACHASGAAANAIAGGLVSGNDYLIEVGTTTPAVAGTVTITFTPFTGVCCISGQPSIDTQSGCALAGGTYAGDNTTIGVGTPSVTSPVGAGFAIADLATGSETIVVADAGTITNLFVTMEINHTFVSDLVIKLANDSANVDLLNSSAAIRACNLSGSYIVGDTGGTTWGAASNGLLTGDVVPPGAYQASTTGDAASSLAGAFGGQPIAGNWTLSVQDVANLDTGAVTSWSIGFNYSSDVCNTGPSCNDLDFNNDGQIEPGDVDAYFSILGEGPCLGDTGSGCDSLDFNNDGNIEPEDVDAYFSVLGEGPCIDN
jgi:subtilisin-like proprotein convertase family protein